MGGRLRTLNLDKHIHKLLNASQWTPAISLTIGTAWATPQPRGANELACRQQSTQRHNCMLACVYVYVAH